MKYPALVSAEPLEDYRLLLCFENGERRRFSMRPYLEKGVFQELQDPAYFRRVRVSFDTVEWPNGADLCPEVLYAKSVPVEASASTQA